MNIMEVKKHIEVSLMLQILERFKNEANNEHEQKAIIQDELEKRGYDINTDSFQ